MDGALTLDGAAPLMTILLFSDDLVEVGAGICFVIYLMLTALVIMQMLIGVLCGVIDDVTEQEKCLKDMTEVYNRLLKDLVEQDTDNDGKISRSELIKVMTVPGSLSLMQDLNINVLFLIQ